MKNIYKLIYSVEKTGARCEMHTFPITDCMADSYGYKDGTHIKRIRKDHLGIIGATRIDGMALCTYITDTANSSFYVKEMAKKVREIAQQKAQLYSILSQNAKECEVRSIEADAYEYTAEIPLEHICN